jgi:uncharacterized protein (TIGR03000 family)
MRMVCAIVFIAILGVEPRAAESTGTAAVTVNVPVGATLFINGQPTHQMTAVRHFITPELAAGKRYRYNLEATYTWDGEEVTKKTSIVVSAGAKLSVDLTKAETVVKPPPPPEPEVKPEPKPEPKPIAKPMPEPKKPELPPVPPPVPNPTEPKPDPPRPQPQPSAPKPPVPKPTEPKPEPSRPLAPPPREHQGKKGK